ncbi:hypothetical protein UY3_12330 [Chelonia mydas]|uniref:Uncharacterized protein n=1 Tax=Chelonia mydas TaxID=8469 RepID=M7BQY9_CHEMY|nr:hypothetical protein UY3_12330 [Chelonia mydas]
MRLCFWSSCSNPGPYSEEGFDATTEQPVTEPAAETAETELASELGNKALLILGLTYLPSITLLRQAEFLSTDSLDAFEEQWALSGVLFSVSPSGSLRLTL